MEGKTEIEIHQIKDYANMFGEQNAAQYFDMDIVEIKSIMKSTNQSMDQSSIKNSIDVRNGKSIGQTSNDRSPKIDRNSKRKHSDQDYDRNEKRYRSRDRSRERRHSTKSSRNRSRERDHSRDRDRSRERDRSRDRDRSRERDRSARDSNPKSSDKVKCNNQIVNCENELSDFHLSNRCLPDEHEKEDHSKSIEPTTSNARQTSSSQQVVLKLSNGIKKSQIEQSCKNKWVSFYLDSAMNDNGKELAKNFIYNSFKTLLKAKKRFIETENLISIIMCNLISDANDVFLYPNHNRMIDEQEISKNCLRITMLLACASNGIKFKPAFMLNHVKMNDVLIKNDNIEHVISIDKWLDFVLKSELEKNMIYDCVCSIDNEKLYINDLFREKFKNLKCEPIVIPNSTASQLSPYQYSLFLTLNGILHKKSIENRKFPINLDQSIELFQDSWNQLTESDIINSFQQIINTCLE